MRLLVSSSRRAFAIGILSVIGIILLICGIQSLRGHYQHSSLQTVTEQYLEARRDKQGGVACELIARQARSHAYGPSLADCIHAVESPRFHFERIEPFRIIQLEIIDGEGHVLASAARQLGARHQVFDWRLHFIREEGQWRLKEDSLLQPTEG